MPFPVPFSGFSPGIIRTVAEAVLGALEDETDERSMFAASPRVPPPGSGWRPLPWLVPRVQARLTAHLTRDGGAGYRLLRCALLTLANLELIELFVSPMAGSEVGRIRFLRRCPLDADESIDLEELLPDGGRRYDPWEAR